MSTNNTTGDRWVFRKETEDWAGHYHGVNNKYPVMDIDQRLRRVEEQLLLVAPPVDMLAKYPALAEAYQNYKIIERLALGNDKTT